MFKGIKNKIINWCLNKHKIKIGDLHQQLDGNSCQIYNNNQLKFTEKTNPKTILIETPQGFSHIKHTLKTVPYKIWKIYTTSYSLECADEHIVIDENNNQIFVKDLKRGNKIITKTGIEPIIKIVETDKYEQMYDLHINDSNHLYYTNDICSHNSTVAAAFLLWYAIFNFDKSVLIASRSNDHAMEMIMRIRFAYEQLPHWLKPGVQDDGWNKHNIGFDNGSRIMSAATSENAGRGFSISLLYLDEFAFVPPNIQEAFWSSISPTLATGGSCIMTSTPNGDMDIYAELWRGANIPSDSPDKVSHNGFFPIRVFWDQPPDRDEQFKEDQIAKIGETQWMQEYECCAFDTKLCIIDEYGIEREMTIEQLFHELNDDNHT